MTCWQRFRDSRADAASLQVALARAVRMSMLQPLLCSPAPGGWSPHRSVLAQAAGHDERSLQSWTAFKDKLASSDFAKVEHPVQQQFLPTLALCWRLRLQN